VENKKGRRLLIKGSDRKRERERERERKRKHLDRPLISKEEKVEERKVTRKTDRKDGSGAVCCLEATHSGVTDINKQS
jgi:hypothetical protein